MSDLGTWRRFKSSVTDRLLGRHREMLRAGTPDDDPELKQLESNLWRRLHRANERKGSPELKRLEAEFWKRLYGDEPPRKLSDDELVRARENVRAALGLK